MTTAGWNTPPLAEAAVVDPRRLEPGVGIVFPDFDTSFWILLATVFVAGIARGMSGFGTGMIVAPVAAALYGPQVAVPMLAIMDSLPTIPVTIPALRLALWPEVLPIALGLALFLPGGVYILSHGDPETLRWVISATILGCAAALWSGVRYTGPRGLPISFGVGAAAGIFSGIASIPGPPVIFYWMSSDMRIAVIRANLLSLFFIGEALSLVTFWAAGLFAPEVIGLGLAATPLYFLALIIGSRLHGLSSDDVYRRVTFTLIVLSAVIALPP